MSSALSERVTVRVRFVSEPCVLAWCWELVDPETGRVLESSWTDRWTAYESPELARAAGHGRLGSLGHRRLVIVARDEQELHAWLVRKFAGEPGVEIVCDRRRGERRTRPTGLLVERRRSERRRRSDMDAELRARGWALVRVLEKAA